MRKPKTKSIRSVRDILSNGPHVRLLRQNREHQGLVCLLRELLPAPSAAHCLSAQQQHATLVVHADSPAWSAKLRFQINGLLPVIRNKTGLQELRRVQLRILPGVTHKTLPGKSGKSRIPPETSDLIRSLAAGIRDEKLRASWLRLAGDNDTH